jgi:syntaxin-binding protein 1
MECPYVQYQGKSALAKALAVKLNDYLTRFYTTQAKEKVKVREPRGTMLICDRSFDLLSPVLHDYYYQQLVHEFKEVGEDGEVMLNEGKQKMAFLNDQDELWVRFRNRHIAEVLATIN